MALTTLDRGVLAGTVALGIAFAASQAHAQLTGIPRVIDGDTIVVNGTHVRLEGIDAPESDQTCSNAAGTQYACGTASTEALRGLIGNGSVTCNGTGADRYGRTLAVCSTAVGVEINRWMVRGGYAIANRYFSMAYAPDEDAAHAEHRGIWAGSFIEPYAWRKSHQTYGYSHSFTHSYTPNYGGWSR